MMFELLGKGLLIGLIFGVPAGAIGALTIHRTLEGGFFYGFFTGMGSSVADVLYAIVGVFGITLITSFLQRNEMVCRICGAILIIVYGIVIIFKKNKKNHGIVVSKKTYLSGFLTAFTVAIMNPATVVSFLVAFTSFGLNENYSVLEGSQIVIGVLLGTGLWWGTLSFFVSKFREKITDPIFARMNMILGILLMVYGIGMMINCICKY
ncbi:MAG: LysE family transporter [Lachnospiraceae bacterium]|nr:LysE family transporter [Lachnospiraceae bacterium]